MSDGRTIPELAEFDDEILTCWEERATNRTHAVLRARFADVAWDLKKQITGKPANVQYAHVAIDAYVDGITKGLYKEPIIHAVHAGRRALELATTINDPARIASVKICLLNLFDKSLQPKHVGCLGHRLRHDHREQESRPDHGRNRAPATRPRTNAHIQCKVRQTKLRSWGAEAAAKRLAAWYARQSEIDAVHRVIRAYGMAFEQLAAQASQMLAMTWLQTRA